MKKKLILLSLLFFTLIVFTFSSSKIQYNFISPLNVSSVHAEEIEYQYHLNKKSKKFHKSIYRYFLFF